MSTATRPAGLWQRSVAWSLDTVSTGPLSVLLAWPFIAAPAELAGQRLDLLLQTAGRSMARVIADGTPVTQLLPALLQDPTLRQASTATETALWPVIWPVLVSFWVLGAAYHVGFECSRWQATPGQRLLGLQLSDTRGRPIRPARALARHLGSGLSWLSLNLGHLMAAGAPQHLALHDRLSGTRVSARAAGAPGWAKAWMILLAAGLIAGSAWLLADAMSIMQTALDRALDQALR